MKDTVVFRKDENANGKWMVAWGGKSISIVDFMSAQRVSVRQLVEAIPGSITDLASPIEECLAMSAEVPLSPDQCEDFRWRDDFGKIELPQDITSLICLANLLKMLIRVEFSEILAISVEPAEEYQIRSFC